MIDIYPDVDVSSLIPANFYIVLGISHWIGDFIINQNNRPSLIGSNRAWKYNMKSKVIPSKVSPIWLKENWFESLPTWLDVKVFLLNSSDKCSLIDSESTPVWMFRYFVQVLSWHILWTNDLIYISTRTSGQFYCWHLHSIWKSESLVCRSVWWQRSDLATMLSKVVRLFPR